MPPDLNSLRVDQIGSLLRPTKLKEIFAKYGRGEASDEELRRAQDEAIRDVVAKQEAHNLPVVTDGEFRRTSFMESFSIFGAVREPQIMVTTYNKVSAREDTTRPLSYK